MSRIICFSIGALVLFAAVHASPVDKEEGEKSGWAPPTLAPGWAPTTLAPGWPATTPGWGTGWAAPVVQGDNAAFGQTLIIDQLAGNQTNSAPSVLEGGSFVDYALTMESESSQVSEIEMNSNSWAPGGGGAEVADFSAYAESGGPYNALNQGAAQANSVYITGALAGGIISNPQTSSAVSAGQLVLSSSGQASNGTNVNPGANSGWGSTLGATNSGVKADDKKNPKGVKRRRTQPQRAGWGSGWGAGAVNQTGSSASSSSLGTGTNVSQAASASDNITAIAIQDDYYYTMELDVDIAQAAGVESFFNGNGVSADSETASAGTEWQNFEIGSYPENNVTLSVYDYASEVAVQVVPTSTTSISIGNITVSDWATASSGTNLVNQNNGWGSSSPGWVAPAAAPPSGWKAPLVEQMGYPVVQ